MNSFGFKLQRLLGFRSIQEEEAKRELGLRRRALEEEAARLSSLRREEDKILEQWRRQAERRIELPRLQVTQEYSRVLENRLLNQAEQYRRSSDRVEEQREVARQYWRKKRMLEILKEKARIEQLRQEKVKEQKFIDDIVISAHYRKGGD